MKSGHRRLIVYILLFLIFVPNIEKSYAHTQHGRIYKFGWCFVKTFGICLITSRILQFCAVKSVPECLLMLKFQKNSTDVNKYSSNAIDDETQHSASAGRARSSTSSVSRRGKHCTTRCVKFKCTTISIKRKLP